jgi:hypothetical protein
MVFIYGPIAQGLVPDDCRLATVRGILSTR